MFDNSHLVTRTIEKNLLSQRYDIEKCVGGIVVSITVSQAVDPGSIPGRRTLYFVLIQQRPYLSLLLPSYNNLSEERKVS